MKFCRLIPSSVLLLAGCVALGSPLPITTSVSDVPLPTVEPFGFPPVSSPPPTPTMVPSVRASIGASKAPLVRPSGRNLPSLSPDDSIMPIDDEAMSSSRLVSSPVPTSSPGAREFEPDGMGKEIFSPKATGIIPQRVNPILLDTLKSNGWGVRVTDGTLFAVLRNVDFTKVPFKEPEYGNDGFMDAGVFSQTASGWKYETSVHVCRNWSIPYEDDCRETQHFFSTMGSVYLKANDGRRVPFDVYKGVIRIYAQMNRNPPFTRKEIPLSSLAELIGNDFLLTEDFARDAYLRIGFGQHHIFLSYHGMGKPILYYATLNELVWQRSWLEISDRDASQIAVASDPKNPDGDWWFYNCELQGETFRMPESIVAKRKRPSL